MTGVEFLQAANILTLGVVGVWGLVAKLKGERRSDRAETDNHIIALAKTVSADMAQERVEECQAMTGKRTCDQHQGLESRLDRGFSDIRGDVGRVHARVDEVMARIPPVNGSMKRLETMIGDLRGDIDKLRGDK